MKNYETLQKKIVFFHLNKQKQNQTIDYQNKTKKHSVILIFYNHVFSANIFLQYFFQSKKQHILIC